MKFLILLLATTAGAHEIGTTRVSATFHRGSYGIEIVTDAAALQEKLAATGGRLLDRIVIAFDGQPTPPSLNGSGGSWRLTGEIPAGARRFTWTYGWTFASYSLTVTPEGGPSSTQWLEGGETSAPVELGIAAPATTRWEVVGRYLRLGFTHILPLGFDHVLFVLGIWLLSSRARSVFSQVSAFTLAHSITLGLSMYGLVAVPPKIVEPAIALSIAYVAVENILLGELRSWRIALVFGFGLLHGMGFAGALKEVGLPRSEYLTALLSFNLGVEGGQLTVIALAFLLVGWRCGGRSWYRRLVVVPASAAIACMAVYWTVQRLFT